MFDVGENLSLINFLFHFPLKISEANTELLKTLRQFHILSLLKTYNRLDIKTISKRLALAHNTTSEIISRMENSGLIISKRAKHDKRIVEVSLSEKGKSAFNEHKENINNAFREFSDKFLSHEEKEIFFTCLENFSYIAKKIISRLEER